MDQNLVYAKTPLGDEAVRQSTRVVQRNLRMVLVQVDGKLSVAELAAKIGNVRLVETALQELEDGGYIAPGNQAVAAWEEGKKSARRNDGVSALSQMSMFGPRSRTLPDASIDAGSQNSAFSTFGKPILPAQHEGNERDAADWGASQPEGSEPSPLPWLRWLGVAAGGLTLLFILVLTLFPYDHFRPEMEMALGRTLQAPVKIGGVKMDILPSPRLVITKVRVGDSADSQIDRMTFSTPFSMLFSGSAAVKEVQLSGVKISAEHLASLAGLRNPGDLQRIMVEDMTVIAGPMNVSTLAGTLVMTDGGGIEKLALQTADRTLRLEARPAGAGLLLQLEGFGWRPVGNMDLVFDMMRAKANLRAGRITVEDIDSTFMGGVLKGSLVIDWSNGISLAADTQVLRLDTKKIAALFLPKLNIEGEMAGSLRYRSSAKDVESFWSSGEIAFLGEIARGVFHGVDFGEAARRGAGYVVRSGNTKFDALRGEFVLNNQGLIARNLQLDAGVMSASGQISGQPNLEVSGNLMVAMRTSVSTLRVPLSLSGTLPNLVVTGAQK